MAGASSAIEIRRVNIFLCPSLQKQSVQSRHQGSSARPTGTPLRSCGFLSGSVSNAAYVVQVGCMPVTGTVFRATLHLSGRIPAQALNYLKQMHPLALGLGAVTMKARRGSHRKARNKAKVSGTLWVLAYK